MDKQEPILTTTMVVDELFKFIKTVYKKEYNDLLLGYTKSLVLDVDKLLIGLPYEVQRFLIKDGTFIEQVLAEIREIIEDEMKKMGTYQQQGRIHIGLRNIKTERRIETVEAADLNRLIRVKGIIVQQTEKRLKLWRLVVRCYNCGTEFIPQEWKEGDKIPKRALCPSCAKVTYVDFLANKSLYKNVQQVTLQEVPENLRAGELPPQIPIVLEDALVNKVKAGDTVVVDGIVKQRRIPSRTDVEFEIYIKALNIEKTFEEKGIANLTKEEEQKIKALAKDKELINKLIASTAPHIFGMDKIKLAIILAIIGGVNRNGQRGTIHVFLIGDPSTGKTQLLKWIKDSLIQTAIFATGQTSSGVGLTAAVVKDNQRTSLSIGPVIQAHDGICIIDEVDKMRRDDMIKLNDAMERGVIRIDKAGFHMDLLARATIIAAANPKGERWDSYRTVAENIAMPPTFISRFALIFIVKDIPNKTRDMLLAQKIIQNRMAVEAKVPIPLSLLRKYVLYARNFDTVMTPESASILSEFYTKMRNQSHTDTNVLPIASRQLADLARLSEAFAKLRLHKKVTKKDAQDAIDLYMVFLKQVGYDPENNMFDIDRLYIGVGYGERELINLIHSVLEEAGNEGLTRNEILNAVEESGGRRDLAEKVLERMNSNGMVYYKTNGKYVLIK